MSYIDIISCQSGTFYAEEKVLKIYIVTREILNFVFFIVLFFHFFIMDNYNILLRGGEISYKTKKIQYVTPTANNMLADGSYT